MKILIAPRWLVSRAGRAAGCGCCWGAWLVNIIVCVIFIALIL
jgi:hypothetical protein